MVSNWQTVKLKEICSNIFSGGTPDTRIEAYWNGNIPWLSSGETGNRYIYDTVKKITSLGVENSSTRLAHIGDIAIASAGQGFTRGQAAYLQIDTYVNQSVVILEVNKEIADPRFLFFNIGSRYSQLRDISDSHSSRGSLTTKLLEGLDILLPPLPEQRAIAGILGALDDKIELNRRMNRTLESMARAVFRHWFVESEEVASWKVGKLGDVVKNFDSKRVPLSNRERAQRRGKYPYYGAASVMDYIDGYLFDGIYILMAEDGSVIGDDDHPVIQYVWGKFWVNNHAHVLQGANGICNEHLYLFLKEVNILPYVTGAVQPKLNQANMNSIPFPLPPMELRKKFEEFVSPLFAKIRANDEESRTLAALRDALLPKLMRGEARVTVHE